ncbi:MAG: hypothetical protein OFPI_13000 [Osedax symbiont Rs2]|nr:MAG: hypothetical protein OFPI_13000 [Osedax symbiont Rs2]
MTEEIISNFEDFDEDILYGLKAWSNYLIDKPLPAKASSLKRLKKLITSVSSTVGQLEAVVNKDPVLSLYVVKAAQRIHNQNNTEVKSILHAVNSLGYDGIEQISNSLKAISLNPTNVQQKRFLHAVASSQHAASQLQQWMQIKNLPLIEESYLAALFYSIGLWSLWLHAPLHMQKIQMLIHEHNVHPAEAEQQILGCSMQMISKELAIAWQLSELTQLAQDHNTSPSSKTLKRLHLRALRDPNLEALEIRELNHITQQKYFPIKLANWLALTASRSWDSEDTLHNIDLISDYMGIPQEAAISLVHKICARSSRGYFSPGIMSPAFQLLLIPSAINAHYKMGAKELNAIKGLFPQPEVPMIIPIADISTQSQHYHDQSFYELIAAHLSASAEQSKFQKPTQVLMAMLQGLEKGLAVKRIALLSVSHKSQTLKTIQSIGFTDHEPMKSLSIPLTSGNLLTNCCNKQSYVVYDSRSAKKLFANLPKNLKIAVADEFMIVSIFKLNRAIAVVYLDMQDGSKDAKITNFIRERSRNLCYHASQALSYL